MEKLIVILDDEQDIVEVISINLKKAGFTVQGFNEVSPFYEFLEHNNPTLIILDVMIPEKDGFEICRDLRKTQNTPIIMLTAKTDEIDRILGLELGADDYVTKPFSVRELVARVKAVTKRSKNETSTLPTGLTINIENHECFVDNKLVKLTSAEFKILTLLTSKKGHVFNREKILEYLWGDDKIVIDRTIDVHVRNLRAKLGEYGNLIENIRGIGYKFKSDNNLTE